MIAKKTEPSIQRQAKSQLAKLMANENLTVEHRAVRTAYFDTERRVLTLPIWTDMTGDIYDTLVGHEVGHALDTPTGASNIIDAIKAIDANNMRGAKMFLNVIEDARIEKTVRRRYPGMRRSFSLGYKQLLERNFFGTLGRDLKSYTLIDKINLHCKLGSAIMIDFSPKERELVQMVENCESFAEVVEAAKAIYAYCKLHKEEQPEQEEDDYIGSGSNQYPDEDEFFMGENSDSEDSNKEDTTKKMTESDEDGSSSGDEDSDEDASANDDSDDESGEVSDEDSINDVGTRNENPTSETQESWERMKDKLLSGDVRGYQYVNIPEIDGHKWIVPYKQVHYGNNDVSGLSTIVEQNCYNSNMPGPNSAQRFELLNKFKSENSPVISFMVKEFEMRKAAEQYARQSIAKTGMINTNKLHTYKYNDDIFRRITSVPNGKNHGLVMIIDWSGSMSPEIAGTIEQLLNMTIFCQRVQIPFEVFAFSDHYYPMPVSILDNSMYKHGDIKVADRLSLLQLLSSTMKPKEMNDALGNLLALRDIFDRRNKGSVPLMHFGLGGTPLDGSLLCLPSIVNAFRKRNKLQIVNTIVLTDGEDSYHFDVNDKEFVRYTTKLTILRDTITKAEYTVHSGYDSGLTKALLQNLHQRTNTNVIGYYLMSGRPSAIKQQLAARVDIDDVEKTIESFNSKRFVELSSLGYNTYYVLKANDLHIESEELDIGKSTSTKSIAKAFGKYAKKKQENRVMLSRFIEKIS